MAERKTRLDTLAVVSLVAVLRAVGREPGRGEACAGRSAAADAGVGALARRRAAGVRLVGSRAVALGRRDGTLRGGVLAGALFAAEFACIFVGLQFTGASRMVVFIYLAPFVVALGMPFIARAERLSALQMAGLVAAFGGVAYALAEGFTQPAVGPLQWIGDTLGVAAAVLWGATTLAIRGSALAKAPAEKTLLYQLAVSGMLLAIAVPLAGEPWPGDCPRT